MPMTSEVDPTICSASNYCQSSSNGQRRQPNSIVGGGSTLGKYCGGSFVQRGVFAIFGAMILVIPTGILADSISVRYTEGMTHGFLVLQDLDGKTIAEGDLVQSTKGNRVTDRMTFHFKDGSLYDETFVFTQRGTFRLLSDHLIEKGPAFKKPLETTIDALTGQVTTHYTEEDGKEKDISERMKLPPDLANGLVQILLKDLPANSPKTTVSMVVATPKPRLVKLIITPAPEDSFTVGGEKRK